MSDDEKEEQTSYRLTEKCLHNHVFISPKSARYFSKDFFIVC